MAGRIREPPGPQNSMIWRHKSCRAWKPQRTLWLLSSAGREYLCRPGEIVCACYIREAKSLAIAANCSEDNRELACDSSSVLRMTA